MRRERWEWRRRGGREEREREERRQRRTRKKGKRSREVEALPSGSGSGSGSGAGAGVGSAQFVGEWAGTGQAVITLPLLVPSRRHEPRDEMYARDPAAVRPVRSSTATSPTSLLFRFLSFALTVPLSTPVACHTKHRQREYRPLRPHQRRQCHLQQHPLPLSTRPAPYCASIAPECDFIARFCALLWTAPSRPIRLPPPPFISLTR